MAVVNDMDNYHLIAPGTYLDRRGRLVRRTPSGKMEPVKDERTEAEDRYVARKQKGETHS